MTTQPDFQNLFFAALGGKPKKQRYRLRFDSNLLHDLQFLSSLVHDARITPARVSLRGKRLRVPLHRDCWEYGLQRPDGGTELLVADSALRLSPVEGLDWELPHQLVKADSELWLDSLYFGTDYWQGNAPMWSLVLGGHDWAARVHFATDEPTVELTDRTVPQYWSDRPDTQKS